ncbi:hypothetical protein HanXRQr2_Chr05g0204921 [Helianthus annuus]|uniref:Uncharacterized protein n=1 Tax=Helianthus annuus TaxID=4232 RepID=A0A9K3NME4_HELAN|nr:hypothetical protein HanXRQr2_Chr05g0204921 [Helianthus annuus]KAJ0921945.1 hypothetical protein HanPSC8_Chr05g0197691 [Helianthus annuus]
MVIKSHLEIKLGINRINWISGILHGLVHRDKLNIMIRVESRRKNGIRILYVIMVKCEARNRCSRGCLVRIRKVRMPQTQRSLGPVNVRVSPRQGHQRSSVDRQQEVGLRPGSHPR